jgi:hypothetical protein
MKRVTGLEYTYPYGWAQPNNQDIPWIQDRTTAKNPGK